MRCEEEGAAQTLRSWLQQPIETGGGDLDTLPLHRRTPQKRADHDERGYRRHREVLQPGQRPWPASVRALRGGRAGVRLPCLLLRVDSEWEGSVLRAVLHQVTPHLVCTPRSPSTPVYFLFRWPRFKTELGDVIMSTPWLANPGNLALVSPWTCGLSGGASAGVLDQLATMLTCYLVYSHL